MKLPREVSKKTENFISSIGCNEMSPIRNAFEKKLQIQRPIKVGKRGKLIFISPRG